MRQSGLPCPRNNFRCNKDKHFSPIISCALEEKFKTGHPNSRFHYGCWFWGSVYYFLKIYFKNLCIDFGCAGFQLQHMGPSLFVEARESLVAACTLLIVACGIQFPDQGWNPGPCIGSSESLPLDHKGGPEFTIIIIITNFFLSLPCSLWVLGFPSGSDGKESACSAGDMGSIPGLGGPPGVGNGELFQLSCLEESMDRGAWWAAVHRATKTER